MRGYGGNYTQGQLWERVDIIHEVNDKFTILVSYCIIPLLRSQKVGYAKNPRHSVLPMRYLVGVWLMEQGSADLNKTGTIKLNQIERSNRREVNM